MRRLFLTLFIIATCTSVFAKEPSAALVNEYIRVSRTQESVAAQLDGFRKQLSVDSAIETQKRISDYLEATMGWDAIKVEYTNLIKSTYSSEELNAIINFTKSAMGSAITRKNEVFSRDIAVFMAKRTQAVSEQFAQRNESSSDATEARAELSNLKILDAERHDIDGRIHFTGTIENTGKRLARGIQVEVNLFNGSRFVDQYTSYVSGSIPAGTSRLFKISCGCKDTPPAKHDNFKIRVVDGGY